MKEEFKIIQDFPNYEVSNLGNIKNIKTNRILRLNKDSKGYYKVKLYNDGIKKTFYVHRLVALAFISNTDNLPQINHKDEDKTNNNVTNLEWCTAKYNNNYRTHTLRSALKHKKKVLQYTLDGVFIKEWQSVTDASKELNFLKSNIVGCLRGRQKTAYNFKWQYKDNIN